MLLKTVANFGMNENTRPLTCIGDAEDSNCESQLNFLLGKDIELDKGCENFLLALLMCVLKQLTTKWQSNKHLLIFPHACLFHPIFLLLKIPAQTFLYTYHIIIIYAVFHKLRV